MASEGEGSVTAPMAKRVCVGSSLKGVGGGSPSIFADKARSNVHFYVQRHRRACDTGLQGSLVQRPYEGMDRYTSSPKFW